MALTLHRIRDTMWQEIATTHYPSVISRPARRAQFSQARLSV